MRVPREGHAEVLSAINDDETNARWRKSALLRHIEKPNPINVYLYIY